MTDAQQQAEWLAVHLLGWTFKHAPSATFPTARRWFNHEKVYTEPPAAKWSFAGLVVEAMRERGYLHSTYLQPADWPRAEGALPANAAFYALGAPQHRAFADTIPEAICAAARRALGEGGDDE